MADIQRACIVGTERWRPWPLIISHLTVLLVCSTVHGRYPGLLIAMSTFHKFSKPGFLRMNPYEKSVHFLSNFVCRLSDSNRLETWSLSVLKRPDIIQCHMHIVAGSGRPTQHIILVHLPLLAPRNPLITADLF